MFMLFYFAIFFYLTPQGLTVCIKGPRYRHLQSEALEEGLLTLDLHIGLPQIPCWAPGICPNVEHYPRVFSKVRRSICIRIQNLVNICMKFFGALHPTELVCLPPSSRALTPLPATSISSLFADHPKTSWPLASGGSSEDLANKSQTLVFPYSPEMPRQGICLERLFCGLSCCRHPRRPSVLKGQSVPLYS